MKGYNDGYMIYGERFIRCGVCHKPAAECMCGVIFITCQTADAELAARQAAVRAANVTTLGQTCGHCGHLNCAGHPPVSLPTAPVEETRTVSATIAPSQWDICPVCELATLYCRGH